MATWYLLRTRIKNRLLSLLKSPGSLIGILVMVALLGFVIYSGTLGDAHAAAEYRSMDELYAIVLALFALMFVLTAKNGLGKGQSLFTMPDVNLLFTSPISNRRILFYGLLQQMGTSLMTGLFLLYQYSWLRNAYGVTPAFMLAIVLAYAVVVFCGQLTAMVIYTYTAGNERRKRTALWVVVGVSAAAVLYLLVHAFMQQDNLLGAIVAAANGLPLSLFPVAGWARELVVGISTGNWLLMLGTAAVCVLYVVLMARWMTSTQSDYYEDVLQATERSFSAITAAKEGKAAESLPSNVRVGKTGIGKGWGASTFFYKQMLEARRARVFILDTMSLIMLAASIIMAYFMRDLGLLPILTAATWMQFFSVSTGRWVRELALPYVYLVPDSPFRKLMACLMETFYKLAVESALFAIAIALFLGLTPLEGIGLFIARLSFGILFTSGLLLVERLFTGVKLKWLVLTIMILMEIIMVIPGIVLAIVISTQWPGFLTENLQMTLLPAICNFAVALIAIFASRNVLKTSELNIN